MNERETIIYERKRYTRREILVNALWGAGAGLGLSSISQSLFVTKPLNELLDDIYKFTEQSNTSFSRQLILESKRDDSLLLAIKYYFLALASSLLGVAIDKQ